MDTETPGWHTLTIKAAVAAPEMTPSHGLTDEEACARLVHFGENKLAEVRPRPA